jgi:two-component system sensor histidine kinase PilS (NtrC family)
VSGSFLRYNAWRLGVALGALAWAVWRAADGVAAAPLFRAVAVSFLVLLIVVLGVRDRAVSRNFQLVQLMLDALLVSVLAEMTGGAHSIFTLLYFPAIWAGAYLLEREGALWTATFATVGYLAMLALTSGFVLPAPDALAAAFSEAMFRVFAFYLMALLIGQLGEQLARTGAALREERASSRQLAREHDMVLERVRAGIVTCGADGVVVSVNPFGRALVGDVRGQPLATVLPSERAEATWEERRADGGRWVCSRAPPPDGGSVIVLEDVTELSQMREVAQRDERMVAAGRMAAGLAHEIRNPLAGISGSLQLLREEHPSRLADLALGEVERLNRLVEDFLSATRRPVLSPRPVDVHAIASEVCEAFGRDPRYSGKISARCAGEPLVAELDGDKLRQALWNLVLNGAQAMPRGGEIRMAVRDSPADDGPEHGAPGVEIEVRDEGVGIPEADRSRIFDPFYTRRSGGTGLGLLLVEQVARGHGGYVRVTSAPGAGTTFTLWLPREMPDAA